MTLRVYFRDKQKKDKFVLIHNCPDEKAGIRGALKIYGNNCDFFELAEKTPRKGTELLETINFEL